jgi:hypothetical protein
MMDSSVHEAGSVASAAEHRSVNRERRAGPERARGVIKRL